MERGLLWLPLLGLFIWLAWAGWNEYQKVEAYKRWASQFKRAKYDIYAVLGQRDDELVWGKPTRSTPIDVQSVKLSEVRAVHLTVGGESIPLLQPPLPTVPSTENGASESGNIPSDLVASDAKDSPTTAAPAKGKVALQFDLTSGESRSVPFTERAIAEQWYRFLASRVTVR